MKSLLHILRQYFLPFNGWPWLFNFGLALLPVVFVVGWLIWELEIDRRHWFRGW